MSRMGELFAQDQLPDVGAPLIPSGGQFSPGLSAVNAMVDQWGRPAPPPDPTVLYNTKAGPITEGDISRATDIAMGFSGGGLSTKPIKAYHSSPHDFDRFDLSKIGTGEGAQVYGHGLYFAENPKVSGQGGEYWNQFLHHRRIGNEERDAANILRESGFDRDAAIATAQKNLDEARAWKPSEDADPLVRELGAGYTDALIREREAAYRLLTSGKPIGPRTYEVGIHAKPEQMLDWDKPLNRQSPEVIEGLQKAMRPAQWKEFNPADASTAMNQGFIGLDKRVASEKLHEAGIPGIRYLDQGSRGLADYKIKAHADGYQVTNLAAGRQSPMFNTKAEAEAWKDKQGTRNYVIFDPNIIEIMKKYGIVGAAPAGMGALAAQDSYRDGM